MGKGGIVRDAGVIEAAALRFRTWCDGNGYTVVGEAASEVAGAEGNREVFFTCCPSERLHPSRTIGLSSR